MSKKCSHRAIQIWKNQDPIWSQFSMKNTITFCGIGASSRQKRAQKSKDKTSEDKLAAFSWKPPVRA